MSSTLVDLTRADLPELDRLLLPERGRLAREREHFPDAFERWSEGEVDAERRHFVARDERGLAGFTEWQLNSPGPGAATLSTIVVRRDLRRTGLARTLLVEAIGSLELDDAVWAGVHTDNRPALQFFLSVGFEELGRGQGIVELRGDVAAIRAAVDANRLPRGT